MTEELPDLVEQQRAEAGDPGHGGCSVQGGLVQVDVDDGLLPVVVAVVGGLDTLGRGRPRCSTSGELAVLAVGLGVRRRVLVVGLGVEEAEEDGEVVGAGQSQPNAAARSSSLLGCSPSSGWWAARR
jgi:hypothetical protein